MAKWPYQIPQSQFRNEALIVPHLHIGYSHDIIQSRVPSSSRSEVIIRHQQETVNENVVFKAVRICAPVQLFVHDDAACLPESSNCSA